MLLYLAFFIYFIILELAVIGLGINFVRIREKFQIHPRLICFIVPLIINVNENICSILLLIKYSEILTQ